MEPWVSNSRLDRAPDGRLDEAWVAGLWTHPGAKVIGVDDRSNVSSDPTGHELRWIRPGGDYDAEHHYLVGVVDGEPWFAVAATPEGPSASLRQLGGVLPETEADIATTAVALVNWHRVAPYCGRCGTLTQVREGGHMRWCSGCERQRFPRTDPAVIVAILDDRGRLLLGHHAGWEPTRVSILAGFVEAGESLEAAVHREIREESGLELSALRYVGSQPWPFPRSLMLGFVARAIGAEVAVDGAEIEWANFYTPAELESLVDAGELTLPMRSSIASRIITAWREGRLDA
ncbi:NAD(+) diphosphatase [Propioniciclava sinopodophylli]|uniref:NAD(+) diphosphatase n=1 Tax=Propioniciclava sinopodophylli TaxID=1837344 RepID=A0A4Q9KDE5_9ACTN|nr:NAD(+) diphosphatase [Propioniciclava sinopodophylli]TBT84674.1 NAD(+) diphosphatase [Propioniciclava sinopodophylli]